MDIVLLFAILFAVATAIGYIFCPSLWINQIAPVFPTALTRVAWGEVLIFSFLLLRLISRWRTVFRYVQTGKGWVDWTRSPWPAFFRCLLGIICAIIVMFFYSFNFWGLLPTGNNVRVVWAVFVIISLAAFTNGARALSVTDEIDRIMKEVRSYGEALKEHAITSKHLSSKGTKVGRFLEALELLGPSSPMGRFGPAANLSIFKMLCSIYAVVLWYIGQETWLGFTFLEFLASPSQSVFFAMLVYTATFE